MRVLVTGGAGFIGRWVVQRLLEEPEVQSVVVVDDLSSGSLENIEDLVSAPAMEMPILGDFGSGQALDSAFMHAPELCLHLAAKINVQRSIDDPWQTFSNDVVSTMRLLLRCRESRTRLVFVSSCMVYDLSADPISETAPTCCRSPYAGAKLAAEKMIEGFCHAYGLPCLILRPFNTYGPFQRCDGEGGVVSVFLERMLSGSPLLVYGDGTQTRDLLYVEDCAEFIVQAGLHGPGDGRVINAGLGADIRIKDLAEMISGGTAPIRFVDHIHPRSEIARLCSDWSLAEKLLGWRPRVTLEQGLEKTRRWLEDHKQPIGFMEEKIAHG